MTQNDRQYEAIVFGATGYTGKYTAEHITTGLPTDFKWAIAGRSEGKLTALANELKSLNPDRPPPGIEIAQLQKADLVQLAKKTKVLITTVGPYHKYGTAVVEACAETGTHYLDVTGETPWVYDIAKEYHETAKRSGAIIIPQNGVESAPSDLLCWALVAHIRGAMNVGTGEIIHSIHDMRASASGGTLATVLTLLDSYGLGDLAKAFDRWSLSVVPPPKQAYSKPLFEKLTGVRTVADLGDFLTDSIAGTTDTTLVHRSWSLYDGGKFYGPNFYISPYSRAGSLLKGVLMHFALIFGFMALMLPPVRWLLQRFVYQPGEGPTKESVPCIPVPYHRINSLTSPLQTSQARIHRIPRHRSRRRVRPKRPEARIRPHAFRRQHVPPHWYLSCRSCDHDREKQDVRARAWRWCADAGDAGCAVS